MKFTHLVPFVALSTAIVYPSEQVFDQLSIEDHHSWSDKAASATNDFVSEVEHFVEDKAARVKGAWHHIAKTSKGALRDAFEHTTDRFDAIEEQIHETSVSLEEWLVTASGLDAFDADHPPHHPPHDRDPHHPPGHGPPGHGPPEHGPHHPRHPHDVNLTVYELIAKSNYTTVLAKLINEYPDLVETLNSTKANFTVFAPTDKAFAKIPEKAPKPSKEFLLKILQYHVLPGLYPAPRVLASHTAPTLLVGEHLAGGPQPQRVAFKLSLRGLTVNWFSRIIAVNIFGTNGVIHGVDSLILPPPPAIKIIDFLPGKFSTLELALLKTGLYDTLNTTDHNGGTLFAPDNFAFERLGPKINAFLFSSYGEKYLKALLEYHVVPDHTLYSDAYYSADGSKDIDEADIAKGRFHVDLPTLLKDRSLSIDVARFGGFITIKINAFTTVAVQDVIAQDGVIHILRSVLIPPKKIGGVAEETDFEDDELTVEELKQRLEPFVSKHDL